MFNVALSTEEISREHLINYKDLMIRTTQPTEKGRRSRDGIAQPQLDCGKEAPTGKRAKTRQCTAKTGIFMDKSLDTNNIIIDYWIRNVPIRCWGGKKEESTASYPSGFNGNERSTKKGVFRGKRMQMS